MTSSEQEQSQRVNREILSRLLILHNQKKVKEDLRRVLEARAEALEMQNQIKNEAEQKASIPEIGSNIRKSLNL